jgi:hypothetical protein
VGVTYSLLFSLFLFLSLLLLFFPFFYVGWFGGNASPRDGDGGGRWGASSVRQFCLDEKQHGVGLWGFHGVGRMRRPPKQGALLPLVGCGPPSVDEKMVPPLEDQVPTTVGSSPHPSQLGWASPDGMGVPRAITYLPNPTLPSPPLPYTPPFPKAILKGVSVVVVGCSGVVGVRCGGGGIKTKEERPTSGAAVHGLEGGGGEGYLRCGS